MQGIKTSFAYPAVGVLIKRSFFTIFKKVSGRRDDPEGRGGAAILYENNEKHPMDIRCLIVDDSALMATILSDLLKEDHPKVQVIGVAYNGSEALRMIRELKPELVFLDVEMPDLTGFEVLGQLGEIEFQTIFITAHSHYAIKAIRFNALDYLVKPIDPVELTQALRRFRRRADDHEQQEQIKQALQNLKKEDAQDQVLFLPTQEGGIKLVLRDIIKIEGDRNYSTIHLTNGRKKVSSKTLGYFEELLAGPDFFRCHRSFLINRAHVERQGREVFVLTGGEEVPVARRKRVEAKGWFSG